MLLQLLPTAARAPTKPDTSFAERAAIWPPFSLRAPLAFLVELGQFAAMSQIAEPEVTVDLLLHAYAAGVFPMAESRDSAEIFWVDPKRRGVFPLAGFRAARSLRRRARHGDFRITLNRDFTGVLDGCANRAETWISPPIRQLYLELHQLGYAHSYEFRTQTGALAGGMYGVALGAAFFGESMFSAQRDASKLVLMFALDHLRRCGFSLFDTQFITPHLASLGAQEITRAAYRARLEEALKRSPTLNPALLAQDGYEVLQRMTHTS